MFERISLRASWLLPSSFFPASDCTLCTPSQHWVLTDTVCTLRWPPLFPYSLKEAGGEDEVHTRQSFPLLSSGSKLLRSPAALGDSESSPFELEAEVYSAGGSQTVSTLNSLVQSSSIFSTYKFK